MGEAAFHVRPVRQADRAAWLALRVELWPESAADGAQEIGTYFDDGCIAGRPHAVFIAQSAASAHPEGFIEVSIADTSPDDAARPVAYLEGWFVRRNARRSGVGRALLGAGEAWCRLRGCATLASDTTSKYAAESIPAHLACGFRPLAPHGPSADEPVRFLKILS